MKQGPYRRDRYVEAGLIDVVERHSSVPDRIPGEISPVPHDVSGEGDEGAFDGAEVARELGGEEIARDVRVQNQKHERERHRRVGFPEFQATLHLLIQVLKCGLRAYPASFIRLIRSGLRHLAFSMDRGAALPAADPFDPAKVAAATQALRTLPVPDGPGRAYLEKHIPRLARTLALVPPPGQLSRAPGTRLLLSDHSFSASLMRLQGSARGLLRTLGQSGSQNNRVPR